jgi:hypothetical protein
MPGIPLAAKIKRKKKAVREAINFLDGLLPAIKR